MTREKNPLHQAAEEVYNEHGFPAGVPILEEQIERSSELRKLALHQAAYDTLRMVMRGVREEISSPAPEGGTQRHHPREQQERIAEIYRGFYSRPLMDGTILGSATRDLLIRDAERYEGQALGCTREAKFLRLVATRVTEEGQKVEEVWTEKELEVLFKKAQGRRGRS